VGRRIRRDRARTWSPRYRRSLGPARLLHVGFNGDEDARGAGAETGVAPHSALRPANFTTFAHFSVSSATILPKSEGDPAMIMPPSSTSLAFTLGSARPALSSLLSLSMISAGVPLGALAPKKALAS